VRRVHALVGWSFLALLVAWPPIHILLARRYHFSTWRYGGFGMYAAPDGADRDVFVFFAGCARKAGTKSAARELRSPHTLGFYYEVRGQRIDSTMLPDLEPDEERALKTTIKDIRSLARPEDFIRLARWVDARLVDDARQDQPIIILVTEPDVDATTRSAYARAFGYMREQDAWSRVSARRGEDGLQLAVEKLGACR
jgi:hypothetical protein